MSISTIGNVGADLARTQDKQNKQDAARIVAPQYVRPGDTVDVANAPVAIDRDTARLLTEAENRLAAESTLTDADFEAAPTPHEQVQAQAREALAAQTNKLPANVLQLLNE